MDFPQRFGKYTLLKRLATGGMAEIFLAHQRGLGGFEKEVVVKRLLPEHAGNEELVAMFLDEARIAAHLTHPNIAQIYDLGAIEGEYFIAMEYVRGVDLRRLCSHGIAVGNYLPLNHAVRIMAEVCDALAYAHGRADADGQAMSIVHRDISPTNILVTYDGGVKLVDFGIAKAANKATVTRSGQVKGKFGYMAPEQARGDAVDARTDIFAVGINLYEITVGRRLFKGGTEIETLEQVERCAFPTPRQVDARFPEGLERVIMRALAREPDARYGTARDLQMGLEEFLAGAGLRSTAGMLAGYMRHIFRDQLALESDEAARLRAMVLSLPPEEPAVRRPFVEAATEVTQMPSFGGASVSERPSFDFEGDSTAVMSGASAMAAMLGGGGGDDTSSYNGPMPGVGTPSPAPAPMASGIGWPATRPPAPIQPTPAPPASLPPRPVSPVVAQQPPEAAVAAWPEVSTSVSRVTAKPPVTPAPGRDPWHALNAAPLVPAPSATPAPRTWAPPPADEAVGGEDIPIKRPRSYAGLLMLLLVAVGGAALYWVMQQDLGQQGAQRPTAGFDLQPRSLDQVLGDRPDAPEVAPLKKTLLRLESDPPGARVVVNGNVLPQLTPTAVQTFEGRWATVRMILPGYLPAEKRLTVKPGADVLSLALEKGAPPTGSLYVDTAPQGAEVTVNGQSVGVSPLKLPKVAALTELTLRIVKAGYYPHVVTYTVPEGKQGDIGIRLVREAGDRRTVVVNVESIPMGANVTRIEPGRPDAVEGRTGNFPLKINALVDQPMHLRAEAARYEPVETTLDLKAPFYTVYLRLPEPELFDGYLSVIGAKGATVYVDQQEIGQTPVRKFTLKEGPHELVIYDAQTKQRVKQQVEVRRDQTLQKSVVRDGETLSVN